MHLLVLVLRYFWTEGPSGDGSAQAKLAELASRSLGLLRHIFSQTLAWRRSFLTHLLFNKQGYDTNAGRPKVSSVRKSAKLWQEPFDQPFIWGLELEFEVSISYYCNNTQLAALNIPLEFEIKLKKRSASKTVALIIQLSVWHKRDTILGNFQILKNK